MPFIAPSQLPALTGGPNDEFEIHNRFSASFWRQVRMQCEAGQTVNVYFTLRRRDSTDEYTVAAPITDVIENGLGDVWWFKIYSNPELFGSYVDMDLGSLHRGTIQDHPFDMQKSRV